MRKYKSIDPIVAATIGSNLKRAREQSGITLVDAAKKTDIHFGQLSRFEAGNFKVLSKNLQIYSSFLQICIPESDETFVTRFQHYAARSPQHQAACKLIVEALEKLG